MSIITALLNRLSEKKIRRPSNPEEVLGLSLNHELLAHLMMSSLEPVERYIALSAIQNSHGLFHHSYEDWRLKRINKILDIYGVEFFKDKAVLELGGGHGDIGAFFADLGAHVLCVDGRAQNVNFASLKHRRISNFKCRQFDLETDFSEFGRFDLIINFGLIYHIKNVEDHLNCCFKISDDILLESVVCDSTDPHKIVFVPNANVDKTERALRGVGSRPSPRYIERIAQESGFEAIRYFTADLNSGQFVYNWKHKNDNSLGDNWRLRRFWRLTKLDTSKNAVLTADLKGLSAIGQ